MRKQKSGAFRQGSKGGVAGDRHQTTNHGAVRSKTGLSQCGQNGPARTFSRSSWRLCLSRRKLPIPAPVFTLNWRSRRSLESLVCHPRESWSRSNSYGSGGFCLFGSVRAERSRLSRVVTRLKLKSASSGRLLRSFSLRRCGLRKKFRNSCVCTADSVKRLLPYVALRIVRARLFHRFENLGCAGS